jgi:hypothetical protein
VSREGLHDVMAIATGDSIYISSSLLRDPLDSLRHNDYDIQRVRGNIGRAGVALMVPPRSPEIKAFDEDRWRFVNHNDFDGAVRDCFKGTSLHLSFTGWVFPVDISEHGACDNEVYILETLISVHDEGEWVGDLDVLSSMKHTMLRPLVATCPHPTLHATTDSRTSQDMVSISSWDEFLDFPSAAAVVLARGNWLARLAFVATSIQRGYVTVLLGQDGGACWKCAEEERERFRHKQNAVFIV